MFFHFGSEYAFFPIQVLTTKGENPRIHMKRIERMSSLDNQTKKNLICSYEVLYIQRQLRCKGADLKMYSISFREQISYTVIAGDSTDYVHITM